MKKILPLSVALIALLLLATCEREWSNPFDPNNTLDPEAWAPQNFQIETTSITERRLTWTYNGPATIQGFKIDRKKGDEAWQVGYQTFPKTDRSFLDTITLNPSMSYYYKLFSYAGENTSAAKETSFIATIPPPNDLAIKLNSITKVSLIWSYNLNGFDGFKIERKDGERNWELIATVSETSYNDDTFELNTDVFYRVTAYHGLYNSAFVENSFNSQIPAPNNLAITTNAATSITLNWSYDQTGHDGFKIERKIDNGNWEMLANNLNSEQRNFTDGGIALNSHIYNYRVYAYVNGLNSLKPEQSITFLLPCGEIITDFRDGSKYETVQIGNQCWMKENLKWLPNLSPPENGSNITACHYVYGYQGSSISEAKSTSNYQTYGVLYNWPAAINACPEGWHLPSDDEWTVLIDFLGGNALAGGKMKNTGTIHWNSPNTGATNSSGFSGLPGGERYNQGSFFIFNTYYGHWWTASEFGNFSAWHWALTYNETFAYRDYVYAKENGYSVRCLRD